MFPRLQARAPRLVPLLACLALLAWGAPVAAAQTAPVKPDKPAKAGKSDKPDKAGKPDGPAQVGKADAPGGATGTPASPASPAGEAAAPAPAAFERRFEDLQLTLALPGEWQLAEQAASAEGQVRASWTGRLAQSDLRASLLLLPRGSFGLDEPSQVIDLIGGDLADASSGGDASFHFDAIEHVAGRFGEAGYASLARSTEKSSAGPEQVLRLAGLLPEQGYALVVRARPPLAEPDAKRLRDALVKGVSYDGEQRDPKWTKAEAKARWEENVPDELVEELEDVLRTQHYIILTNSSGGKSFAKKMEECYAAIRKVYPFDEVPERRLMPVFLFRTNDQYYAFFAKSFGMTVDDARRTGGVASGDFYTTWYEAPGDPVHIHEATHQIFRNRLGLVGGGSWFQEGVAEYMSSRDNERVMAANAVTKGKHVPLPDFVQVRSLIFSAPKENPSGEDTSGNQYKQAALFIEFLHDGKFAKDRFLEGIHAFGAAPRNDLPALQAAAQRVYQTDLAGLEKEFVAYCRKR